MSKLTSILISTYNFLNLTQMSQFYCSDSALFCVGCSVMQLTRVIIVINIIYVRHLSPLTNTQN